MTSESRQNAIRELAYTKWEQAGWPSGDGIQFWLEAEQELFTDCGCDEFECSPESDRATARKTPNVAAFAPVEPPPLILPKTRKKVG